MIKIDHNYSTPMYVARSGRMSSFECSHCTKIFQSRKEIVRHLRKCDQNRSDIKRYPCSHCPREFFSVSGLIKHGHKKHGVKKRVVTKSLKCSYCSVKFASTRGRNAHAKKVHQEYVAKLKELNLKKVFDCIFCSKSFAGKTYRNQHENVCMAKSNNLPFSSSATCTRNYEEVVVILPPAILQASTPNNFSENIDASLNLTCSKRNSESSATPSLAQSSNEIEYSQNEIANTSSSDISNVLSSSQVGGDITPNLQRYLRDRKSFLKLGTPDMDTPRKSRLNLKYGQHLVVEYKKKINSLQQQVRRLQKEVKTYKDLILHLENQNIISKTAVQTFLVCKKDICV